LEISKERLAAAGRSPLPVANDTPPDPQRHRTRLIFMFNIHILLGTIAGL
jgi:hypothetical protein